MPTPVGASGPRGGLRRALPGGDRTADRRGLCRRARADLGSTRPPGRRRPVEERDDVRVETVVGVRGPSGGISHDRIMAYDPPPSGAAARVRTSPREGPAGPQPTGTPPAPIFRWPSRTTTLCDVVLYAAYGSNLDPRQMLERAPHSPAHGPGWLVDWRLTFGGEDLGWDGALATVVEDPGHSVFVMLYDIAPEDEPLLDRWEGSDLGIHRKLHVRVQTLDGDEMAWLYVVDAYEGGLPSARYLGIMAEAARAAGAPDDYVVDLMTRPCQ